MCALTLTCVAHRLLVNGSITFFTLRAIHDLRNVLFLIGIQPIARIISCLQIPVGYPIRVDALLIQLANI
jgi:hypothetical protein